MKSLQIYSYDYYKNIKISLLYRVAPQKNGTVDFSGLCSHQVIFFTLLGRASFPHYNNTKIIKFGGELFILWVISNMDCHFRDLPLICHYSCLGTLKIGQIPKMTVHRKLLMKLKVLNQIWWSWCYYNEEKMLYPARWKKIKFCCWSEQSPEKSSVSTVLFFVGHLV